MRFGEEYRRSQSPEWSSCYLAYDTLKTSIKIEYGKARSEGRPCELNPILEQLEQQCRRTEKLYLCETSRLSLLQTRIAAGLEHILKDRKRASPEVALVRSLVAGQAVTYLSETAKSLVLFAKVNSDAAFRILEKLNRANTLQGTGQSLDLRRFDFFVPTSASLTLEWAKETPVPWPDAREIPEHIREADVVTTLDQFLLSNDLDRNERQPWSRERLCLVIQLAGFHKSSQRAAEDESNAYDSEMASPDVFNNVVSSIVEWQASKLDSEVLFHYDKFGRSPLHYAAEHGLRNVASVLLRMAKNSQQVVNPPISSSDSSMYQPSPLVLAVVNGDKRTIDMMLASLRDYNSVAGGRNNPVSPSVARTALEVGDMGILESILEFGTDLDEADDLGQLLLCVAVRCMPDAVHLLLEHGANINLVEPSSGRTAFGLACIQGNASLAQLMLSHGADPSIPDARGWLAIEHAGYRGHFKVLRVLAEMQSYNASETSAGAGPMLTAPMVQPDQSPEACIPWIQGTPQAPKGFESYDVWIRLGNMDASKPVRGLKLNEEPKPNKAYSHTEEVLYTIHVAVDRYPWYKKEWTLPLMDNETNKPWAFKVRSIEDLKLKWKLYTYSSHEPTGRKLVGSGIAYMGSLNSGVRKNKESLVRNTTIPLLDPEAGNPAGSITFSYFWSLPHPPPEALREPRYWEFGNGIGGHRGSGKNSIGDKKLQIGENTAQSFSTAVSHGASFIEYDVQVTKDLVPVIYHDLLISETGTDSPMHTLTYDQFKYINAVQGPKKVDGVRSRSNSLQGAENGHMETFQDRMSHTHFNKVQGFKANTRGNFIHEKSLSLEELFKQVDKSVSMNIELKYPMLFEADEWDMELLAIKTEIFVNTILDKVYEHAAGRTIVFSSFNPEICIALSTKQRTFPVFFLSKTASPKGELRSSCIQQAVHFAKSWGLPGIVTECTPAIACPRLIEYVKSAGLTFTTFGVGNSSKENVKTQFDGGINAVISDSIQAIKEIRVIADGEEGPEPLRIYA